MARVLVCDDANYMRTFIKDVLEEAGHEIVGITEDAHEAIRLYEKLKPDIVTMDILMKVCGIEGIKGIRKIDKKAKIIVVSVLSDQEAQVVEAIQEGALGIVVKPIKRETIIAEIDRVLKL